MGYLVNLVLDGRQALVVGGGAVAARKIEDLLTAGARVHVVAVEPCPQVRSMAEEALISGHWRPYETADLEGAFIAVAATDDESLNARISADAQARNILVNVVDRPPLCTFTLPAVGRRGRLTVAVATDGLCPSLAGVIRGEIMERYGPEYEELVDLFGKLRAQMIAQGWDGRRITASVRDLYHAGIAQIIAAGDRDLLVEFLRTRLGPEFRP
jgi:precorrin-2 dehydrogenase/sirohydrochlorin ferrochelatase